VIIVINVHTKKEIFFSVMSFTNYCLIYCLIIINEYIYLGAFKYINKKLHNFFFRDIWHTLINNSSSAYDSHALKFRV
jgi:hypothetical protein